MDPIVPLLKWVVAHDPYKRVVLASHQGKLKVGSRGLLVIVDIASADTGLPAQLLALGMPEVEVVVHDSAERMRLDAWKKLTPGLVREYVPTRQLRSGTVLELGAIALPRRSLFGFSDGCALNLAADSAERTYASLELLATSGKIPDAEATPIPEASDDAGASAAASTATSSSTEAPGLTSARTLVASGCVACGVCAANCPSQALTFTQGDTATLTHSARACRGCADCVSSCPSEALTQGEVFTLADSLDDTTYVVASVKTSLCPECGARFTGNDGVCGHCSWKAQSRHTESSKSTITDSISNQPTPEELVPDFVPESVAAKLPADVLEKLAHTPRL